MPSYIIESLCAVTVDITFITFDITYIMQIYKLFLNFNVRWGRGRGGHFYRGGRWGQLIAGTYCLPFIEFLRCLSWRGKVTFLRNGDFMKKLIVLGGLKDPGQQCQVFNHINVLAASQIKWYFSTS